MAQQSNLKIDSIKVFGERHSGTNAIGFFAGKNFNLKFKHYDFLGWKHRLAPSKNEWSKFDVSNCLFIFCFRNPYSWLKSMHIEPYYDHYPKLKELSFENFLQFSIEDYENAIIMWNKKNESYIKMSNEVPNSFRINVEDFHESQSSFHSKIGEMLNVLETPLHTVDEYMTGRGRKLSGNITESLSTPNLKNSEIEVINSFLSNKIMEECGYSFLSLGDNHE